MEENSQFSDPLGGIKVLDLSHVQSGPTCTVMLADMGAEVIKVEPFSGDQFRGLMEGASFFNLNRNKRSIALNLKTQEGKAAILKLAKDADIFVENFLPGVIGKLGFGYEELNKLNPRIIYCSISGFGQSGPLRDWPGYDPTIQAISGIMDCTGEPDRPPSRIRPAMIDNCTGIFAAFAVVTALLERGKTGRGQRIDMALLDVAIHAMSTYLTDFARRGVSPQRAGSAHPGSGVNQNFKTKDGFICIVARTDNLWKNLCKALDIEHIGNKPKYATAQQRTECKSEIAEILSAETQKYTSQELETKLIAAGVPCGKIRNIGEIMKEPHVQARGLLEESDYPSLGKVVAVKTPIIFSGKPVPFRRRAPMLGEHTKEVLKELNYTDPEIEDLVKRGVALQHEP
jgi:crotonobetainyl-CoA:carnitine CoA-transferase CaiB-like acyl-CoA transferase